MEDVKKDFETYEKATDLLKALAHPVRLCIVRGLTESGSCNVTHMYDCMDLPQSTVSQHIAKLKSAGLLKGVRSGTEIHYQVCPEKLDQIRAILQIFNCPL